MTERPTYFANGRKGADVYGQPQAFRDAVSAELGSFPFFHFWGPKAGLPSSKWIVDVARKALRDEAPDLLLCYAPGLDYEVQRFGPKSDVARDALRQGDDIYRPLIEDALNADMDVCVVSDYGFTTVDRAVFPNRILRDAGYITIDPAVNGALLKPVQSQPLQFVTARRRISMLGIPKTWQTSGHCCCPQTAFAMFLGPTRATRSALAIDAPVSCLPSPSPIPGLLIRIGPTQKKNPTSRIAWIFFENRGLTHANNFFAPGCIGKGPHG